MALPLDSDNPPMEARPVHDLPEGEHWRYEPKWDGFRCLAFRDGQNVELRSKSGQSLGRYFPDVAAALSTLKARQFVLDGEIIIPIERRLSFEALQLRLHPAESRVRKLAAEHPAVYILFDLLVGPNGKRLTDLPFTERRTALEAFFAKEDGGPAIRLSPSTPDRRVALGWLDQLGGDIDGMIAKRADLPYLGGSRDGMQKYKLTRTADCVVGGFRYNAKAPLVGSLLLGLYDDAGLLNHVGFTATLPARDKPELTRRLVKLVAPSGFTGRAPGGPSRWSTERSGEWQPLRPELVVEVRYDHVSESRFRHGTTLLRWRPDKAPRQCTFDQLPEPRGGALDLLEGSARAKAPPARKRGAGSL